MGCLPSRDNHASMSATGVAATAKPPATWLESTVQQFICGKEKEGMAVKHPFNKILLKFPLLRLVFKRVRAAFQKAEGGAAGSIALASAPQVLAELCAHCKEEDMARVFAVRSSSNCNSSCLLLVQSSCCSC